RLTRAERRAEHGVADVLRAGADVHRDRQVGAAEHNALVRPCRAQGHEDLLARVQADTGGANRVFERPLSDHAYFFCYTERSVLRVSGASRAPSGGTRQRQTLPWAPYVRRATVSHQSACRRRKAGMSSRSSESVAARSPSPTARCRWTVGLSSTA